ncbi:CehA/McbA family metallohydrolase [Actinoplanes sp. NPDC051633]|uniref:CehA/McbA family metallohydrolase n=1 Tax=Actinoplanes sp. NPDC051633 TaxID=3155670 RepID=UPI00343FB787
MCCDHDQVLDLPPAAIEMLAHYRELRRRQPWAWGGEDIPPPFRWARFAKLGDLIERGTRSGDWPGALQEVIGDDVPAGIVVRRGGEYRSGPPRLLIPGRTVPIDLVTEDDLETVDVGEAPFHGAVRMCAAVTLRLKSPACARWSVVDESGGAWFPDGVPPKWDFHGRPFFHGHDISIQVPAAGIMVTCTKGLEFGVVTHGLDLSEDTTIEADPPRLFDPAAAGWYGGDLHVHLNYSGDLVCEPEDAARMQRGEGLHLMNLVAGNFTTSRIFDRELLESTVGTDLWPGARMGLEYRNDLLGHVHALGPSGTPTHYHAGHEGTDAPDDWPPNAVACEELQNLGATIGYAHPAWQDFPDWSTDRFFASPRSVEARELIADAALGLVDSVDLLSPADAEGSAFLYHRLLSCGFRLAASAGTDVFLSFAHGPAMASNPPGWARVYAHLGERELSVPAFQDAIRDCRTVVTNGPWLTLSVDGAGPGAVLDRSPGDELRIEVGCVGDAEVTLIGPDGEIKIEDLGPRRHPHPGTGWAATYARGTTLSVDRPTWIAAVARAEGDDRVLDEKAFAHTSPVWVDVAGRRVVRERDVRWCLDYLDRLSAFTAEHGRFSTHGQRADLADVIDRARSRYRTLL